MPFQNFQHGPPAERQQTATVGLAQRFGEGGEGDAEAYELIILRCVDDTGHKIQIGKADIFVDEPVYLVCRQLGIAIEVFIGSVEDGEELTSAAALFELFEVELPHLQAIAFPDEFGSACKLRGCHGRDFNFVLHVVVTLGKAS